MTIVTVRSSADSLHIRVRIAAYEYRCCRTPPRVGDELTGQLTAYPYPAPIGQDAATRWDRDRDVVVMAGVSARWDPTHGDPLGRPIAMWMSWHNDSLAGVEATGVVATVDQLFYESAPVPGRPRRELQQPVNAIKKFPADLVHDDGTVFVAGGAQVALDELVLIEPTPVDAEKARAIADRGRRTLTIVGPAACFGTVVPYEGERIRVDLDDDRLSISSMLASSGGIVIGTVTQVGRVESGGLVGVVFPIPIEAGIPTSEVTANLFVVVVVDSADEGHTDDRM